MILIIVGLLLLGLGALLPPISVPGTLFSANLFLIILGLFFSLAGFLERSPPRLRAPPRQRATWHIKRPMRHIAKPSPAPGHVPHPSSTWRPLPPMFKYFGGKSRMAPRIIARIPQHKTFVEPFAGGASVTLAKPPSTHEVLADKRADVVKFYRHVKGGKRIHVPPATRKVFQQIKAKPETLRSPGELVRLQGSSFGGNGQSFADGPNTSGQLLGKRLPLYRDRLANTTILNRDYKSTIKRYDSPKTAFSLDPPYPTDRKEYADYGRSIPTPHELRTTLANVKGKVLLSYPNLPSVTKEFKPPRWHIDRLKVQNAMYASTGGPRTRTELLIRNYPVRDRWWPETTTG